MVHYKALFEKLLQANRIILPVGYLEGLDQTANAIYDLGKVYHLYIQEDEVHSHKPIRFFESNSAPHKDVCHASYTYINPLKELVNPLSTNPTFMFLGDVGVIKVFIDNYTKTLHSANFSTGLSAESWVDFSPGKLEDAWRHAPGKEKWATITYFGHDNAWPGTNMPGIYASNPDYMTELNTRWNMKYGPKDDKATQYRPIAGAAVPYTHYIAKYGNRKNWLKVSALSQAGLLGKKELKDLRDLMEGHYGVSGPILDELDKPCYLLNSHKPVFPKAKHVGLLTGKGPGPGPPQSSICRKTPTVFALDASMTVGELRTEADTYFRSKTTKEACESRDAVVKGQITNRSPTPTKGEVKYWQGKWNTPSSACWSDSCIPKSSSLMSNFNSNKLYTSLKSEDGVSSGICVPNNTPGKFCTPARVNNYSQLSTLAGAGIYDKFALDSSSEFPDNLDASNIITLLVEYEACGGDCEAPCYADCGNGCAAFTATGSTINTTVPWVNPSGQHTEWYYHEKLSYLSSIQDGSCAVGNLIKLGSAPGFYPYSMDYSGAVAGKTKWGLADQAALTFEKIGETGSQPPAYLFIEPSGNITSGDRINWCNASPNLHFDIFSGSESGLKNSYNLNNASTYSYKPVKCNIVGNFSKPEATLNPCKGLPIGQRGDCEMIQNSFIAPSKTPGPPGPPSPGGVTCKHKNASNINWPSCQGSGPASTPICETSGGVNPCNVDISYIVDGTSYSQNITPCNGYMAGGSTYSPTEKKNIVTPPMCPKTWTAYDLPTFNNDTKKFNNGCCCESWGMTSDATYSEDWINEQDQVLGEQLQYVEKNPKGGVHPYWEQLGDKHFQLRAEMPPSLLTDSTYCPHLYISPDISQVYLKNGPIDYASKTMCDPLKPAGVSAARQCMGKCVIYESNAPQAPKDDADKRSTTYQYAQDRIVNKCLPLSDGYGPDACIGTWKGTVCGPSNNTCSGAKQWGLITDDRIKYMCEQQKSDHSANCFLWDTQGADDGYSHVEKPVDCSGWHNGQPSGFVPHCYLDATTCSSL